MNAMKWTGKAIRAIGLGLMFSTVVLGFTHARAADSTQPSMMAAPPPMMDSTLMSWVGTWGGDVMVSGQAMYGEAVFTPAVGHQWMQGAFRMWTDKTKKTPVPMEFMMYLRPTTTPGTYKAVNVASDGTGATATVVFTNGVGNWSWTYDNDTKEAGTLTRMSADHLVYKGTVSDKAGNTLMEITQDMNRIGAK